MKEAIRCCISCIFPCGALDVVRIVHADGRVELISGGAAVFAGHIMEAYPKHVLRKLPSPAASIDDLHCSSSAAHHQAVTLPPTAQLKRGKIYFLMPMSAEKTVAPRRRRKRREQVEGGGGGMGRLFVSTEQYLTEIMAEKVAMRKERRRGRVAVWRPELESISELCTDL